MLQMIYRHSFLLVRRERPISDKEYLGQLEHNETTVMNTIGLLKELENFFNMYLEL